MKIISLSPSITEILFKLGFGSSIIGVCEKCDSPADAMGIERVSSYDSADIVFSEEKVAAKRNVVCNPQTLDEIFQCVNKIGRELGREDKANALTESMKSQLLVLGRGEKVEKKVFVSGGPWVKELVAIAGGSFSEDGAVIEDPVFSRWSAIVDAVELLVDKLQG